MKRVFLVIQFTILLLTTFSACQHKVTVMGTESRQYIFSRDQNNAIDTSIYLFVAPFHDSLSKSMNSILCLSAEAMTKELPEGNLGNLCADACMHQIKIASSTKQIPSPSFCFLNHGGLRASLPKGPITLGNIFELMPFENELVLLHLSGIATDSLIQFIANKGGAPVSGIRFQLQNNQALNIRITDSLLNHNAEYWVLTSDYLANGGDGFEILKKADKTIFTGLKVRDAIINELKETGLHNDTLKILKDGRISKI